MTLHKAYKLLKCVGMDCRHCNSYYNHVSNTSYVASYMAQIAVAVSYNFPTRGLAQLHFTGSRFTIMTMLSNVIEYPNYSLCGVV